MHFGSRAFINRVWFQPTGFKSQAGPLRTLYIPPHVYQNRTTLAKPFEACFKRTRSTLSSGSGPQKRRSPFSILDRVQPTTVVVGILAINTAVFITWQMAITSYQLHNTALMTWMNENFTVSWKNIREGRIWTTLTCVFSHANVVHFLINSVVLYTIAPPICAVLGTPAFLVFYAGTGVAASVFSVTWRELVKEGKFSQSQGASGATCALISLTAILFPSQTLLLFGVIPLPAWALVAGLVCWDGYKSFYPGESMIDSAAHLGGLASGGLYYLYRTARIMKRW